VSLWGTIHRISYSTNTAPQAVVSATPATGAPPLAVSFDGRSSNDPDGDPITYAWDLDDDGDFDDGTGSTASWTYTSDGDRTARLRVTDSHGASGTATTEIVVGGEPTAVIGAPAAGTTFAVGDRVSFSGTATDPQDGDLAASALAWALVLHHCSSATTCHQHPIGTWSGVAEETFTVPDHEPPSYLELTLTATDSTGLKDSVTQRIDLKTVAITVDSDPDGVSIGVGDGTVVAPTTVTVFAGSRLSLSAPLYPTIGGRAHRFDRWSDGAAATHDVIAPATATTYRAFYSPK
jgi:PKD repeat protein